MRRRSGAMRLVLVGGVALVALVAVGYALLLGTAPPDDPPPLAAAVDPRLPDLTVGPLTGITGGLNEDGTQSVRFGVMIVNQGEGDFLLRARRSNALADDWQVTQRIADEGGYTERPSPATLVYGGDGHDHWHIKEVESHVIEDLDGNVLGQRGQEWLLLLRHGRRPSRPPGSARDEGVCIRGLRRPVRQRQPDGAVRRLG